MLKKRERKDYYKQYNDEHKDCQKKWYQKNKEKIKKRSKEYYQKHKEERKEYREKHREECRWKDIHRTYHLGSTWQETKEIWMSQFRLQNGVCAICAEIETTKNRGGTTKILSIDHNHTTNKFRGLLCSKCNIALGNVNENKLILKRMIEYLE